MIVFPEPDLRAAFEAATGRTFDPNRSAPVTEIDPDPDEGMADEAMLDRRAETWIGLVFGC